MRCAVLLLCLLAASVTAGAAHAQPAPAPAGAPAAARLTPAEAQQVLEVLQDPARRAQFIGTLQEMAKALPPSAAPATASNAPAAPAAKPAAKVEIAPNALGAEILRQGSQRLALLSGQLVDTARAVTDFPLLWRWFQHMARSRSAQAELRQAGWRLLLVLGIGLGAEGLVVRALRRPRGALDARGPGSGWRFNHHGHARENGEGNGADAADAAAEAGETETMKRRPSALAMMRRVPFVLLGLMLDLIPVAVFAASAYAVLALVEPAPNARLVILALVDAYLTCRVLLCITRMFVAPATPRLRLVPVSDATAAYIVAWVRGIVGVAVFGRALAEVGLLYGLYPAAHDALLKLFMLVAHLFVVVIVLQNRSAVARRIRARPERSGAIAGLRNRLAEVWHYIAIFYVMALWLVWAFEVPNGYARLLHFFVVTAAILLASRLAAIVALGGLDRGLRFRPDVAARFPGLEARAERYHPLLRGLISGLVGLITVLVLCQSWGLGVWSWFGRGALGGRAAWALVIIALTLCAAVVVWESVNLSIQRQLARFGESGQGARAARLRTLLPLIRTALLVVLALIAGPTALAEIGVNIAGLLAGAGIIGVAIGFGSQKLVQDCITGLFLLLENTMQVGDQVTVAGLSGTVENLSIRTLRLRGGDGSVYIVPFSAVTTVNNTNRGLGNATISVNVSYREDTDRVGRVLQEIAAEMRTDPAFQRAMLSDFQLWGVDKVEGAGVTIVGQIVCTDAGRWPVQREFNRRMKKRFQELAIEISTPTQTVVLRPAAGPPHRPGEDEVAGPPALSAEPVGGTPH